MKDFISLTLILFALGIQQSYAQFSSPSKPLDNSQSQSRSTPFSFSMRSAFVEPWVKMGFKTRADWIEAERKKWKFQQAQRAAYLAQLKNRRSLPINPTTRPSSFPPGVGGGGFATMMGPATIQQSQKASPPNGTTLGINPYDLFRYSSGEKLVRFTVGLLDFAKPPKWTTLYYKRSGAGLIAKFGVPDNNRKIVASCEIYFPDPLKKTNFERDFNANCFKHFNNGFVFKRTPVFTPGRGGRILLEISDKNSQNALQAYSAWTLRSGKSVYFKLAGPRAAVVSASRDFEAMIIFGMFSNSLVEKRRIVSQFSVWPKKFPSSAPGLLIR